MRLDCIAFVTLMAVGSVGALAGPFGDDVTFLKKHTDVILLKRGKSQVALAPAYQGRVMTSTTGGKGGPSFGWLNYKVIEGGILSDADRKGTLQDHIYVFGGEERFWLGPEGGQFAIYFKPGDPFDFDHWHTPAPIDTEAYRAVSATDTEAVFEHACELINHSGTTFKVGIRRAVSLLDAGEAERSFGTVFGKDVSVVTYRTDNKITNLGDAAWTKETGMLSIWMLGMYKPTPGTTVVIPFKGGPEKELGPKVNDAYFGKVPPEYLKVEEDILFFKGDGTRRGKIGISPERTKGIAGSYDADGKVLTLVTYNVPKRHASYVNSMWELQKEPFKGDALNAYNDGSPGPGLDPLGPFYELETSSPAAALNAGESIQHIQTTVHITGDEAMLDPIARKALGVGLEQIKAALK